MIPESGGDIWLGRDKITVTNDSINVFPASTKDVSRSIRILGKIIKTSIQMSYHFLPLQNQLKGGPYF